MTREKERGGREPPIDGETGQGVVLIGRAGGGPDVRFEEIEGIH